MHCKMTCDVRFGWSAPSCLFFFRLKVVCFFLPLSDLWCSQLSNIHNVFMGHVYVLSSVLNGFIPSSLAACLVYNLATELSLNLLTSSFPLVLSSIFSYSLLSSVCLLFSLSSPLCASINHGLTHPMLHLSGILKALSQKEGLSSSSSCQMKSSSGPRPFYGEASVWSRPPTQEPSFSSSNVAWLNIAPSQKLIVGVFLNVSKNLICPLMHLLLSDRPGSTAVVAMLFYPSIIL